MQTQHHNLLHLDTLMIRLKRWALNLML